MASEMQDNGLCSGHDRTNASMQEGATIPVLKQIRDIRMHNAVDEVKSSSLVLDAMRSRKLPTPLPGNSLVLVPLLGLGFLHLLESQVPRRKVRRRACLDNAFPNGGQKSQLDLRVLD